MLNHGTFDRHLHAAVAFHGHLCLGQVIGVRLAMLGLELVGITDPLGADRKKLIVFVEIDRCAADAIMTVTGARVGRRSLKIVDYGKLAATFINLETGVAFRIFSHPDAQDKALALYPALDEKMAQMQAYQEMEDAELFQALPVRIPIKCEDMPGRPTRRYAANSAVNWCSTIEMSRKTVAPSVAPVPREPPITASTSPAPDVFRRRQSVNEQLSSPQHHGSRGPDPRLAVSAAERATGPQRHLPWEQTGRRLCESARKSK